MSLEKRWAFSVGSTINWIQVAFERKITEILDRLSWSDATCRSASDRSKISTDPELGVHISLLESLGAGFDFHL